MKENTMTINHLNDEIITLFVERLNVEPNQVSLESDLEKDLGADSLDIVELIMDIERKFGVAVSDADAATIRTVGDAVRFVHAELSKN